MLFNNVLLCTLGFCRQNCTVLSTVSYILHIVLADKLIARFLSIYLSFSHGIDFIKNEPLLLVHWLEFYQLKRVICKKHLLRTLSGSCRLGRPKGCYSMHFNTDGWSTSGAQLHHYKNIRSKGQSVQMRIYVQKPDYRDRLYMLRLGERESWDI